MSAFGGQLRFDGGTVTRAWLDPVAHLLARRGPDSESIELAGPVGMVFRSFGNTREDLNQSSLWRSRDGALLAFDGRLDNGPDLAYELGLNGADAGSDSGILLRGFERWGADFVGQIVGDFALAYWNPAARELTLGRDALGARTLYYHHSPQYLAFATDLGSLVCGAAIDRELDDDFIVGFLAIGVDEEQTAYRKIRSVRPAHAVVVSIDGDLSKRMVWSLPRRPDILKLTDGEYEERLWTLFREAVKCRLRTSHPVVAEVSGGLDSSSVFCMADDLIRSGEASVPSLTSASFVTQLSPTSSEAPFRQAVEAHCGREAFHIHENDRENVISPDEARAMHVLSPLHRGWTWSRAICVHMRERGAHTVLTGHGGDEMFRAISDPAPGLGDLWVQWRLLRLRRELHAWSHALRQPYLQLAWQSFEAGVLRRQWRPEDKIWEPPMWVHARHRERARALHDVRVRRVGRYALPSCQAHASGYCNAVGALSTGAQQDLDPRNLTYPCLHRPLVEYLHVVPFSQKLRIGQNRSLQRRALRRILPAVTFARRGKAVVTESMARLMRHGSVDWTELLKNSVAEACGYVDMGGAYGSIRRAHALMRGDSLPLTAIGLEMWLRTHIADTQHLPRANVPGAFANMMTATDNLS